MYEDVRCVGGCWECLRMLGVSEDARCVGGCCLCRRMLDIAEDAGCVGGCRLCQRTNSLFLKNVVNTHWVSLSC
jgi:hypothetical protein